MFSHIFLLIVSMMILFYWINNMSRMLKILTIKYSIIFGLFESMCRYIINGLFYTTHQQFIVSMIFFTLFIIIHNLFSNIFLKIFIIYPTLVWVIEIICHYYMKYYIYGFNPAWNYSNSNNPFVFFDGAIRLDYYPVWVILSFIFDKLTFFIV